MVSFLPLHTSVNILSGLNLECKKCSRVEKPELSVITTGMVVVCTCVMIWKGKAARHE